MLAAPRIGECVVTRSMRGGRRQLCSPSAHAYWLRYCAVLSGMALLASCNAWRGPTPGGATTGSITAATRSPSAPSSSAASGVQAAEPRTQASTDSAAVAALPGAVSPDDAGRSQGIDPVNGARVTEYSSFGDYEASGELRYSGAAFRDTVVSAPPLLRGSQSSDGSRWQVFGSTPDRMSGAGFAVDFVPGTSRIQRIDLTAPQEDGTTTYSLSFDRPLDWPAAGAAPQDATSNEGRYRVSLRGVVGTGWRVDFSEINGRGYQYFREGSIALEVGPRRSPPWKELELEVHLQGDGLRVDGLVQGVRIT